MTTAAEITSFAGVAAVAFGGALLASGESPLVAGVVTVCVAAFAAIPPSILAWAALRQGRINSAKTDVVLEKTDGHLSKLTSALEVANEKISGLETLIVSMGKSKDAADSIAEARVAKTVEPPAAAPPVLMKIVSDEPIAVKIEPTEK